MAVLTGLGWQPFGLSPFGNARDVAVTVGAPTTRHTTAGGVRTRRTTATVRP